MPSNIHRRPAKTAAILAAALLLTSCGTTPGDRGLSGGLLGAGTGAAIGSAFGAAGKGALIGGLGGVALGLLTSPGVINLGEPAWRRTASNTASNHRRHRTARAEDCTTHDTATARITTCPKVR